MDSSTQKTQKKTDIFGTQTRPEPDFCNPNPLLTVCNNSTYAADDKACRYALNDDELSIKAQCSFNASVILLHHSNLRIGAESKADNKAK